MQSMKAIISIVERGKGAAMQKLYAQRQVFLHLQCPGRGTATSEILDILGLGSSEKDVVISIAAAQAADRLLRDLDTDLRGSLSTSGIVFDLPLTGLSSLVAAAIDFKTDQGKKTTGGEEPMEGTKTNSLILISCNRGYTGTIMATAKEAGARGGTVIKARWSGVETLEQAYDTDLQAEKEIVAIVVPNEKRNAIMEAVNAAHGLRSDAQSMVCSLGIDQIVRLG